MSQPHLILASQSPRRRTLLAQAGFRLTPIAPELDERVGASERAQPYAERIAREKAESVARVCAARGEWNDAIALLAADTVVYRESVAPLGKPESQDAAVRMLMELQGETHTVSTAFAIVRAGEGDVCYAEVVSTEVRFKRLTTEQVCAYVSLGESSDKAGAYGIQGIAGTFVEGIHGSWDNVVGLPVSHVIDALLSLGLISTYPWALSTFTP